VWGMGYGLWYAVFCRAPRPLEHNGASLAAGFGGAAERTQRSPKGLFVRYRKQNTSTTEKWMLHGHWIGLAMVLIVLGDGLDRLAFRSESNASSAKRLTRCFSLSAGSAVADSGPGQRTRALAVLGSRRHWRLVYFSHGVRTQIRLCPQKNASVLDSTNHSIENFGFAARKSRGFLPVHDT